MALDLIFGLGHDDLFTPLPVMILSIVGTPWKNWVCWTTHMHQLLNGRCGIFLWMFPDGFVEPSPQCSGKRGYGG